jgi:hypothetical protein
MKQQVNARVSEATRQKLDELTTLYGTQAEVLAVAIDRLWHQHYEKNMDDGTELKLVR